jgi:hypothetical protein
MWWVVIFTPLLLIPVKEIVEKEDEWAPFPLCMLFKSATSLSLVLNRKEFLDFTGRSLPAIQNTLRQIPRQYVKLNVDKLI